MGALLGALRGDASLSGGVAGGGGATGSHEAREGREGAAGEAIPCRSWKRPRTGSGWFAEQPALRGNAEAIDAARRFGEAHSIGMPQIAYAGLQITVSMCETEMDLAEELRDLS